ncbi:MAG: hypothetical protein KGY56_15020 [Desulfobacterales bacterium]|nr:hypothetical protein [Desulfobacterales bacterium]
MKKALVLALVIIFLPLSASGMTILTIPEMAAIIARAGVAIEINNIEYRDYRGELEIWYQPEDVAIGFVWGEGSHVIWHINAVLSGDPDSDRPFGFYSEGNPLKGKYSGDFNYGNTVNPITGEPEFEPRPMEVSAKEDLPVIGQMLDAAWEKQRPGQKRTEKVYGMQIKLPTIEIYTEPGSYDQFDVLITTADNPLHRTGRTGDPETQDTWSYGTIYYSEGGSAMTVLSGTIEITPLDAYLAALP